MTDLEPMLREHFSTEADSVPVDANLLEGVDRLRRDRRRRRFVGGGSALAVVVIAAVVAVPLAVVGHHDGAVRVTVSPNQPAVPATPPPGERAVTWAGIQFYVPATWPGVGSDSHRCARNDHPGGEVDYGPGGAELLYACAPAPHPVLQRLELGTAFALLPAESVVHSASPSPPDTTTTAGELAGLPATYAVATAGGQLITSVRVPSLDTVFTITADTKARTEAILASAHRVTVDENGCAVDQPADLKAVAGGGGGGPQVVGEPVSGLLCSYSGGRLVMGAALDAKSLGSLVADLNRLPARYTSAELDAQRTLPLPGHAGVASIILVDKAGERQQITVRGPGGGPPGVAGATQSTLTVALFFDLGGLLPSGFGGGALSTGLLPNG